MNFVNFTDPSRPRIPKVSSKYLQSLAHSNAFLPSKDPCENGEEGEEEGNGWEDEDVEITIV